MKSCSLFSDQVPDGQVFTLHNTAGGVAVWKAAQQADILLKKPVFSFISAPGAAGFMGVGWWHALIRATEQQTGCICPHILDCGDSPGYAMFAASQGQKLVVLEDCSALAFRSVSEVFAALGGYVFSARPPSFDLELLLSEGTDLAAGLRQGYSSEYIPGDVVLED